MRSLRLVALLAIPAQIAFGQQGPTIQRGSNLSLEDATTVAMRNNPLYLQTQTGLRTADAQVRSAYGALLPTSSASIRSSFQQGGTQIVQGVQLSGASSDTYNSNYSIGLNYSVTAAAAYLPRAAKANRAAAEADITSYAEILRATIAQQYITALQNDAQAAVLDTLVQIAEGQLDLVNAKMKVGAGTIIDVRTAEVALGQAQVNTLTAHNNAQVARLRLFQTMGVPADPEAKLTTTFTVARPTFTLDSVLDLARRVNPDVLAKKSREYSSQQQIRVAQANYLPSLYLGTGYGANAFGYADSDFLTNQALSSAANSAKNCAVTDSIRVGAGLKSLNCGAGAVPEAQLAAIRASNKPFKFNKAPYGLTAQLSIPVFNGFQREQQVEQARVAKDIASYDLRARNLQLTTDVSQNYLSLVTAAKTVELQTQIAAKAAEDLALNEASFRVGAKTFLDVSTARATFEKTQIDRVNSIYEYHKAFAALENAVGRPLR